ncbi:MAG TPA: hypothetical protein VHM16_06260, partial [Rubrobacteraceae bacterium]|nr:hypothetical protein [Rubrobacteraceae bacterium]
MKGSRSESSGASLQTEARRPVWLIDLALVATTGLMLATDLMVLCFHIIFVLLTFGAFFWEFKAFAWRAALWVLFAATVVFLEVLDGTLPFDEIIEIPLLTTILVLVFLIARRRAQAQTRLKEQDE